jgi:hypothetical protein
MSQNGQQAPPAKGLSSLTCNRVEQIDQHQVSTAGKGKMIVVIEPGLPCFIRPSKGLDRPTFALLGVFCRCHTVPVSLWETEFAAPRTASVQA